MIWTTKAGGLAWRDFAYISLLLSLRVLYNQADEVTMTTFPTTAVTTTRLKSFVGQDFWLIRNVSGVTWSQAAGYCGQQYGGRLAVVDDVNKIEHITNELKSFNNITPAWLGATSNESLQHWITVNGSNIKTGQGQFEESNEDGNCLAITSRYRTIYCSSKFGFYLCDLPRKSDLSQCDTETNCLTLFNGSDLDWFEARNECLKAGGDLASVLNPDTLMEEREELQGKVILIGGYHRPWWWMSDITTGMKEVLYYNWIDGMEKYTADSCLATTSSGWQPIICNDTTTYYICEGIETESFTTKNTAETRLSSTQSTEDQTSTGPNVTYIIIGCLAGGLVLLIIIVVILVMCLRRARKQKESEEFQYQDRRTTLASSLSSSGQISTISTQISSPSSSSSAAAAATAPAVVQRSPDPYGIHNYIYEEAEPVRLRSGTASVSSVSPYAASSIESIMERGSAALNQDGAVRETGKPKGSALNGLIKRLSLLMKRDYDETRDALPSAATTLQRNPDVVPMTSFNPYEDTGERGKKTEGAVGGPSSSSEDERTLEPGVSDNVYTEVNPRKGNIDLTIVDNRGYVSQL